MRKYLILTISIAALLFGLFSCKENRTAISRLTVSVDSLLGENTQKPFNGIVLIAQGSEPAFYKKYGFSDLENKTPFGDEDQFVVGSVSKQFTAVIVLQEYEKGNIDLFAPIRNYLPQLLMSWADTITVHHLLAHTHGITALDAPTKFSVGTAYDYSQIGYDLLAQIAEKASGQSFVDLSDALFEKCNMHNTFHPNREESINLVKGYEQNQDGELEYTDQSLKQYPAAGAFISSAPDLLLWNENLFGGKLLKSETFGLMTEKKNKAIRNHPIFGHTEYGYGITVADQPIVQWGQTGLCR